MRGTFEAPEGLRPEASCMHKVMTFFALGWEERCVLLAVDLAFAPLSLALDGSCQYRKRGPLYVRWYDRVPVVCRIAHCALVSGGMACNATNPPSAPHPSAEIRSRLQYQMKRLEQSTMFSTNLKYAVQSFQ